jgi:hypothetical protein
MIVTTLAGLWPFFECEKCLFRSVFQNGIIFLHVLAALWDSEKIREVAFLLRILLRSMLKNGQSQAQ